MESVQVREKLVEAMRLDLVGPTDSLGDKNERLSIPPTRWYLTGFLAPSGARAEERSDETVLDEIDAAVIPEGVDDEQASESNLSKMAYFPSSMGLSFILRPDEQELEIEVNWGEYSPDHLAKSNPQDSGEKDDGAPGSRTEWKRNQRREKVKIKVQWGVNEIPVPHTDGVSLLISSREVPKKWGRAGNVPSGARSASVFLVNNQELPASAFSKDVAYIFQAEIKIKSQKGFIPRPNIRGIELRDWDEKVADVQYRDVSEYLVGHGIAGFAHLDEKGCHLLSTTWLPRGIVEKVDARSYDEVELRMEELSQAPDAGKLRAGLEPLVELYGKWIAEQASVFPASPQSRVDTCKELISRAHAAKERIQRGIDLLNDPVVFKAFKLSNQVMALSARKRTAVQEGKKADEVKPPAWRMFQLAFILLNLTSIVDRKSLERNQTVDLLFFPTGGGKTEAYLGIAAFTLLLRRLRDPSKAGSCGVSVLMRYTLRLLTLDQLGRAAALVCGLEILRKSMPDELGQWPFEVGLWVGSAATPNKMGAKGDKNRYSAREKTNAYKKNSAGAPAPIPIEKCPWCNQAFSERSFVLSPNQDRPIDLHVVCGNRDCEFSGDNHLPILGVDEQIYRRLPCFLISTVDKFAALPWTGETGALFGLVDSEDGRGFYNSKIRSGATPIRGNRLLPPDLIIQDELHLISGPLGTVAGLYEGAIDHLCSIEKDGTVVRPKIIASTATVRRADQQIQRLFDRSEVHVFPPQGPNYRDSFFAVTKTPEEKNARMYLGVAAQGRSSKVIMLKTYLALMGSAARMYEGLGSEKDKLNPVDPYMTVLGYFNSLRELGGSRRIVEDEVKNRLTTYSSRKRLDEEEPLFGNRMIGIPVELTSRVSTSDVSNAKDRLEQTYDKQEKVDVALATNMISVGLDIVRLGLMVVMGQPKTTAEYIQSTSRVGRDDNRPGLVVTLLNIHKHRDRSHYERFPYFHRTFYREVEVTSVTPFSPRALDKALAGALVSLIRHGVGDMTPSSGAGKILANADLVNEFVEVFTRRASNFQSSPEDEEATKLRVHRDVANLIDQWKSIAEEVQGKGVMLKYQKDETPGDVPLLHQFLDPKLEELDKKYEKFRANRSMRDVEATVALALKSLDYKDIED